MDDDAGTRRSHDDATRARLSADTFGTLARIVHRTAVDAAAILRRDGLNPAQFQLLRTLTESPGLTQAEVVSARGITPGGVSQLVTRLVDVGLLRREPDGAANRLWPTDEGLALVARLTPDQDAFFARRFAGLDDAQLEQLRDLAARALDRLPDET